MGAWYADTGLQSSNKKARLRCACGDNCPAWHLQGLEVAYTASPPLPIIQS